MSEFLLPNQHDSVPSVSTHVASFDKKIDRNLIKAFWVTFGVFEIENFKKLVYISICRRPNYVQKIQASN